MIKRETLPNSTSAVAFEFQRPTWPPPPATSILVLSQSRTMASTGGGPRHRPPPPPLRLQQSTFTSPAATPTASNISMSRGEIITTTAAGPGTGPNTPTTAQLLYELPPELVESRRRMAQEQKERSRARHTLQTQYRAQQAAAIGSRSRSGSNDAAGIRHPRPVAASSNGRAPDDTIAVADFELRTPVARHSISGPPSARPRSTTPSHALMSPVRSDLETFAQHCKAWSVLQNLLLRSITPLALHGN